MNWTCTDRPLRGVARGWQEINQPGTKTKIGLDLGFLCAPGGIRTPNRQIRRRVLTVYPVTSGAVNAGQVNGRE
jgi:hypothetical protein